MLELRSPLGAAARLERTGVVLEETANLTLTQVAGETAALRKLLGKIPGKVGVAQEHDGAVFFKTGAKQLWIVGKAPTAAEGVYVTPLSSSRTRISLSGESARDVLAASAAIDFHEKHFKPGHFVMTGIHHTPVLIHCVGDNSFHIYAMRTFALAVWKWLSDAAEGIPN
jgi:heterotetrameric sarcosine oxidase gamma subunit